jgi:hypothetical protein
MSRRPRVQVCGRGRGARLTVRRFGSVRREKLDLKSTDIQLSCENVEINRFSEEASRVSMKWGCGCTQAPAQQAPNLDLGSTWLPQRK